jgi:hypothetical protein
MSEKILKKPETPLEKENEAARQIDMIVASLARPIDADPTAVEEVEVSKRGLYGLPVVSGPILLTHVLAEERRIAVSNNPDEDTIFTVLAFLDASDVADSPVMELTAHDGNLSVLAHREEYFDHDAHGLAMAMRMLDWFMPRFKQGYLVPVEHMAAADRPEG